jgi:hypothetical protein
MGHGVFVLHKEEIEHLKGNHNSRPMKCIRFLHKPTEELMRSAGAIVGKADYDVSYISPREWTSLIFVTL